MKEPWCVAAWVGQLDRLLESGDVPKTREFFREVVGHFPSSWEWRHFSYEELEKLFAEALRPYGNVRMWRLYLRYINLSNGAGEGEAHEAVLAKRQTIVKAFELAVAHIGLDIGSLPVWRDYIKFIHSWSTQSLYEQQVQMDQLRKVYHRALTLPLEGIETLWHDYDAYENGLNKLTAKKFLADKSPAYMTARAAAKELREILSAVDPEEYALPPSEVDAQLAVQKCALWMRWVSWEKSNPLKIPESAGLLQQRIVYAYRCALTVLRHFPELWYDYSRFLIGGSKRDEAESVLRSAVQVLPGDLLVNFALADLLEGNGGLGEAADAKPTTDVVRVVYENLVQVLQQRIDATSAEGEAADREQLIQNVTLAWIQYMNYSRRIEGITGARAVFTRARKLPHLTFHIFVAAAKLEFVIKRDAVVAGKIFELGMSRFATNAEYVLEYLQHLINLHDEQNTRALFERSILAVPPGPAALELWKVYLDDAFKYADQTTIRQLERRFQDAYPEQIISRDLSVFCRKYSYLDAMPAGDRVWAVMQEPPQFDTPVIRRTPPLPKPFTVPEVIEELLERLTLPTAYDGPALNPDGMLRLLQVVRLIPDERPAPPLPPTTRQPPPKEREATRKGSRSGKRSRHHDRRLEGGEEQRPAAAERVNVPIREDDIFARRYRERQ